MLVNFKVDAARALHMSENGADAPPHKVGPKPSLRNLTAQWCTANGIPYDPLENSDYSSDNNSALPSKAQVVATKATACLLVRQLKNGLPQAQTVAAMEIRFLAKTGKHNQACIAEAGAILLLKTLLSSQDSFTRENSMTALLNLSIYDKNKAIIMDVDGCLASIVEVLTDRLTIEARENAAATPLQPLGCPRVQEADRPSGQGLMDPVPTAGGRDPSGEERCCNCHIQSFDAHRELWCADQVGGVRTLGCEQVAGLVGMMRCGTPRGKENAVAALPELCRSGGGPAVERVACPDPGGPAPELAVHGDEEGKEEGGLTHQDFPEVQERVVQLGQGV